MKNQLKISSLSVVCALCATMAMPAFAASSVRSLGGAGTYNSASSAAAAKTSGKAADTTTARAGSLRVNNATSSAASSGSTRAGSTRASSAPRLSIGKYLAGSSAVSGGSTVSGSHAGKPGPGAPAGDVKYLEEFVGYTIGGDTLPEQLSEIKLDVESLKSDLGNLTGVVTDVVFDETNGALSVVIGEEPAIVYNLSDYFDGRIDEALQSVLDDLGGELSGYYTKDEVDVIVESLKAADSQMATKEELEAYAKKGEVNEISADMLNLGEAGAVSQQAGGGLLMLQKNADGSSEWINVLVD